MKPFGNACQERLREAMDYDKWEFSQMAGIVIFEATHDGEKKKRKEKEKETKLGEEEEEEQEGSGED